MPERLPSLRRVTPSTRVIAVFLAGALFGALSMVKIVPASSMVEIENFGTALGSPDGGGSTDGSTATDGSTDTGGAEVTDGTAGTTDTSGTGGTGTTSGNGSTSGTGGTAGTATTGQTAPPGVECAPGRNGGATDQGVTENSINMATTIVASGIGKAFLGEVRFAMDAVKNRVNREGGICGRLLDITYVDDGWDASDGAQFLRNFLEQGDIFAVPVGPSSEGLNIVIERGDFDKAQVPVVGTDGLIVKQYEKPDGSAQPWVWPVSAATVSSARIMAVDAFERAKANGETLTAEDFSIVFDFDYKFGEEGAEAFNQEVNRLTGGDVPGYSPGTSSCTPGTQFCAVDSGASSYAGEVDNFQPGKFVALFLEPDTGQKFMTDKNATAASDTSTVPYGFGAAQPLFTAQFAKNCGAQCDQMMVWTGFKPFQEEYRSDPAVQAYVNDLHTTNSTADENNQFSLGAYIGMELLVEGLRAVGPDLKRVKLKAVLDQMQLSTGLTLTDPMVFSPSNRYVATNMQAWVIQYGGVFGGWKSGQVVTDPDFR